MSQTSWEAYVHIVQIIALWRTNNQHEKRHHYSGAITGGDFQAFSLFFAIVVEGHLMSECLTEKKKWELKTEWFAKPQHESVCVDLNTL